MSDDLVNQLREMLDLDPTLRPTDRRVLETLMLSPRPATARELSRVARTNAQSMYTVLDRLEERGLVLRAGGVRIRMFRAAHPSALLQEIIDPARRISDLAAQLEEPLRRLYEAREAPGTLLEREGASTTASLTASLSSLLDMIRNARQELWVIGSDDPWISRSKAIESELSRKSQPPDKIPVRLLVRPPLYDSGRTRTLERMRRAGVGIRYSEAFRTPMVVTDRRFIVLRSAGRGGEGRTASSYSRLEAPDLAADIAQACEREWELLAADEPRPSRRADRKRSPTAGNASGRRAPRVSRPPEPRKARRRRGSGT